MDTILKKHIGSLSIVIIISLALVVGGVVLLQSLNGKLSKIADIKERVASYQKNKKAFTDEVVKIQSLEKRVSDLEASVVTSETVPALLSSLESLAKDAGVSFEITSVQNPTENDTVKLVVESSLVGSQSKNLAFLEELQHQPFQVRITKLFLFSEEGQSSTSVSSGVLSGGKSKATPVSLEKQWRAIVTIEIVSF
jgi:Tfp pilus assembly protein PilO